jgi:SAM-dependent methyltransferase
MLHDRFGDRVEDYVKYRPGYPPAILEVLRREAAFTPEWAVADVGCGPGNLARLFLENGNTVYGVEPNEAMRAAGERLLAGFPRFRSVDGTAEATTLPHASVDLVAAGQAFHWFEPAARREFGRILRPGGFVLLAWNDRRPDLSPLAEEIERLQQRYGLDYEAVRHRRRSSVESIRAFFGGAPFSEHHFANAQEVDLERLTGRLLSSSYAPRAGHPNHRPFIEGVAAAFRAHQAGGRVALDYNTLVYLGRLGAGGAE